MAVRPLLGMITAPRLPSVPCADLDDEDLALLIRHTMQCVALDRPSEYLTRLLDEARRRRDR